MIVTTATPTHTLSPWLVESLEAHGTTVTVAEPQHIAGVMTWRERPRSGRAALVLMALMPVVLAWHLYESRVREDEFDITISAWGEGSALRVASEPGVLSILASILDELPPATT